MGMSSIPECLTAHHANMAVLAFCLVTNQVDIVVTNIVKFFPRKYKVYAPQCAVDTDSLPPSHEEVLDAAATKEGDLRRFVAELIKMLASHLL